MQALVHFTVGVVIALLALTVVDWPPRDEFLLVFASGFWALVPDGHWLFREFGVESVATPWRAVHRTFVANLFWFHQFIDSIETGRPNLEAGVSLAILTVCVLWYYTFNDWTIP